MADTTYTPGSTGIYFDKEDFKYYRYEYDLVDVKYDEATKTIQIQKGSKKEYTNVVDLSTAFTDNTAGSTNSTSKLFLVGAEKQDTCPQTYSNSSVYTQNGYLYSKTPNSGTDDNSVATTSYVQSEITSALAASDAMIFKGTLGTDGDITALPNTTAKTGWTYRVNASGYIASGSFTTTKPSSGDYDAVEIGDLVICLTDGSSSKSATWTIAQTNIDGAVTTSGESTENHVAVYGANNSLIKDSGFTIGKSVPSNAEFTDTKVTAVANHYGYDSSKAGTKTVSSGSVTFNSTYVLTGVTIDAAGHVTAVTGGKLPAANNYSLPTASTTTKGGVKVGTGLTMSGETLNHSNSITAGSVSDGGSTRTLAWSGTFKIPVIKYDAQGHITETSTITLTMPSTPADVRYTAGNQTTTSAIYLVGTTSTGSSANSYATSYTKSNITIGTDGHLRDSTTVGSAANTDLIGWRAMTTSEIDLICTI